jgi:hypothetical protein
MTNYLTKQQGSRQRAALTRAINTGDPAKIEAAVRKTVGEWNDGHFAWPDDWSRWQRALDDSRPWSAPYLDITAVDFA